MKTLLTSIVILLLLTSCNDIQFRYYKAIDENKKVLIVKENKNPYLEHRYNVGDTVAISNYGEIIINGFDTWHNKYSGNCQKVVIAKLF